MTDSLLSAARQSMKDHGAVSRADGEFRITTTPFDASVRLSEADGAIEYRVHVIVPTLEAAVADEAVAPVVQEGWFETFERRIESVGGITRAEPDDPRVRLDLDAQQVHVSMSFESSLPAYGTEDAKALVDFVEGTYVQGIVPGYEYGDPVDALIDRAADRSQSAGEPPI